MFWLLESGETVKIHDEMGSNFQTLVAPPNSFIHDFIHSSPSQIPKLH